MRSLSSRRVQAKNGSADNPARSGGRPISVKGADCGGLPLIGDRSKRTNGAYEMAWRWTNGLDSYSGRGRCARRATEGAGRSLCCYFGGSSLTFFLPFRGFPSESSSGTPTCSIRVERNRSVQPAENPMMAIAGIESTCGKSSRA